MRKSIIPILLFTLLSFSFGFAQQIQMPQASPSAKISQKVGLTDVTVDYSRPSTKGRKIFGELVPFGQVWRTGANSATTVEFSTEVNIQGNSIPKGKYALYSIPGKNKWTVVLSKNTQLWGAIGYSPEDDILRFDVTPNKLSRKYETFEISFNNMTDNGADLSMKWENTRVDFRITTEVDPIVMAQIKENVIDTKTKDPSLLYAASSYYFTNNKDLDQAYEWISESVSSDPKYWTMHLKAKIEAKLGKKEAAKTSAKESMKMAEEAKNPDYVGLNERLIKSLD
ncbi:Protein of unknown function [Algoriphagus ornithinivorans]|uniref:DUF2911 domain-containing protein n=1 Tax=Algoriphagus ornithinivorans TaxID=226506 RepID=A0A1I5H072_9BACT|nr:DUF2911 domain-containing protein [Algoriphagus ornithinivorans]SFO41231.1 Protein of unknown function [Algoriphagus ornithinivorans]